MVVRLFGKLAFELCLAKSHWRFFWIDLQNIRLLSPLLQWRSRPSWQYNTVCRSFATVVDKLSQTWRKTEGTPWKRRYDLFFLSRWTNNWCHGSLQSLPCRWPQKPTVGHSSKARVTLFDWKRNWEFYLHNMFSVTLMWVIWNITFFFMSGFIKNGCFLT